MGQGIPRGITIVVAAILVLDQFPRHMFRASARAFAADPLALETARLIVALGYDRTMLPVERLFAYLPFEHSEALADQLRACELTEPLAAFPETDDAHDFVHEDEEREEAWHLEHDVEGEEGKY